MDAHALATGDCPNFRGAIDGSCSTDVFAAKMGLSPSARPEVK